MAAFWRHNGWVWDLLNADNPAGPGGRDANPWSGNSLLWDDVTGNAGVGVLGSDPQRFGGLTAGFDVTGAPAGVPSPALPPVGLTLGDVADLPVNEVTPSVPNEPSSPG
jgi:hypothetical protein